MYIKHEWPINAGKCVFQAVQEFGAMCQERQPDVVKGVLPYWPRIYCRISVVREE